MRVKVGCFLGSSRNYAPLLKLSSCWIASRTSTCLSIRCSQIGFLALVGSLTSLDAQGLCFLNGERTKHWQKRKQHLAKRKWHEHRMCKSFHPSSGFHVWSPHISPQQVTLGALENLWKLLKIPNFATDRKRKVGVSPSFLIGKGLQRWTIL